MKRFGLVGAALLALAVCANAWETDFKDTDKTGRLNVHPERGALLFDNVAVTATAAELNVLDGITATVAELNALDMSATAGTVGTNGESVVETAGIINKTTITFNNIMTATDGSDEGETETIYTFPAGRIYILGGAINATIINTATEADTNDIFLIGVGTASANDDADLSDSNETDIFAGPTLEDGAVTLTNQWEGDITAGADSVFDGTSTAVKLCLNMGIADACITTNNFSATVTGDATIFWINLGGD